MSREGSGRVAVLKTTGLVRSYTLECNYNTGRLVNVLPPCVKESKNSPAVTLMVPPKYTPQVFEEVKELGKCTESFLFSKQPFRNSCIRIEVVMKYNNNSSMFTAIVL
jgi:hypothetical protein